MLIATVHTLSPLPLNSAMRREEIIRLDYTARVRGRKAHVPATLTHYTQSYPLLMCFYEFTLRVSHPANQTSGPLAQTVPHLHLA